MDAKKELVVEAWGKTFGNVTETCLAADISRQTYYNWLEQDPEFKAAIDAAQPMELKLDFVENKLVDKINQGDTACLIFVAKTLGKKRGYVERQEITGADGEVLQPTININVVQPNKET